MFSLTSIPGFYNLIASNENSNSNSNSNILKLNKMHSRINNALYSVINYNKEFLSQDLIMSYGLCRSIIINNFGNIVCFAPPKSISAETFIQKYQILNDSIIAEEFIEGTMINVFFDIENWEISTRNTVGATSSFYKSSKCKTFRQMFNDAATICNLNIEQLDKKFCYSFVLQHPENRIVIPFSKPNLYLVGVYEILDVVNEIFVKSYNANEFKKMFSKLNSNIKFPVIYNFNNYNELIEKYGSMNTSYDIVGAVIHNKETGERTKIRNPVYEHVRSLRGNQPKLQYQYLSLRKEGKVKDYLKFYPENKYQFSEFRNQVHIFTETLYNNYIECYIKKQKTLMEYSLQYRNHMFNIHKLYMNDLRVKKQFITNTIVQKYVNELHTSLLMHSLNYQMRKSNIDSISMVSMT